jgi:hypothetical protein
MDFISIADTAWRLHRKLGTGSSGEDDDFAEISGSSASLSSASTSGQTLGFDASSIHSQEEISVLNGDQARPFLSPSAEAELLLLATNFLLCKCCCLICSFVASVLGVHSHLLMNILTFSFRPDVAMVIITAMIAKLYFPECLESRRSEAPAPRSYAYRMVDGQNELIEQEDDDSDGAEQDEYLDSGDEQDPVTKMYPTPSFTARPALEFDQETMSKAQVLKRLLFCSLMLNVTFVTWGLLQERMLTRRYPRLTGEYFTYSYALVFTNRFWTLIISSVLWIYLKPRRSRSTVIYEYSFPSISNMLSSWCQYEALRYVSFPATTLFKSFKLAPVMAMGKILGNKTCEYTCGRVHVKHHPSWLTFFHRLSQTPHTITLSHSSLALESHCSCRPVTI